MQHDKRLVGCEKEREGQHLIKEFGINGEFIVVRARPANKRRYRFVLSPTS